MYQYYDAIHSFFTQQRLLEQFLITNGGDISRMKTSRPQKQPEEKLLALTVVE